MHPFQHEYLIAARQAEIRAAVARRGARAAAARRPRRSWRVVVGLRLIGVGVRLADTPAA